MEEQPLTTPSNPGPYLIPSAIIVAGVLIALAVIYANSQSPAGPAAGSAGEGESAAEERAVSGDLVDGAPFLGNPAAPVTMVEFSDFQCPFCRRMYIQTLPQIKEKYVKTGKVKFAYRDFPLSSIHDMAQKYAEAARCANDQDKFWQMHDKIFDEQELRGAGTIQGIKVADIKQWARDIGLNQAQFDECLDSEKYAGAVQKDFDAGQALGVSGTPATFINGRLVQGAVPFSQFEAVIEEELKK